MIPALVLAAGLGTRIRPVAGALPKPLIPFGGPPILVHNLRWLAASGVRTVWINLHYQAASITAAIGNGAALGLDIAYLFEPDLLGTAGAFGNLGDRASGTALVVYGDNLLRFDLAALLARHRATGAAATIALFDRARHTHTGIAGGRVDIDTDGRVLGFIEGGAPPPPGAPDLVNAGVYAVEPEVRRLIPPGRAVDFGREVFPAMLHRGDELFGHVIESGGYCLGLDTPESHRAGTALLEAGAIALA